MNKLIFKAVKKKNFVNLEFFHNLLYSNISKKEKVMKIKKYFFEYISLKRSISNGKIYLDLKKQNSELKNVLIDKNTEFFKVNKILHENLIKFLHKQKLNATIDFSSSKKFIQIGLNLILVEEPVRSLWNTGNCTIFMPVKENVDNIFEIEILSIPPIEVKISISGKRILEYKLKTLEKKLLNFKLHKNDILDSIIGIEISTDKYWLPNKIIKEAQSIPLGVGIKSIRNCTIS